MVEAVQNLVRITDKAIASLYLSLKQERAGLLCFLFHSLFLDETQIAANVVDPLQHTTVAQLRQFIEYYLESGYRFIGQDELLGDLDPNGKFALLTFDDGYFNNTLARPLLEEFKVPAVFFISTDNVRENKCYWWDVLYRELMAKGASPKTIYGEQVAFKKLQTEQMEENLRERFGAGAFTPRGDIDRPFSTAELRDFAQSPFVYLGNHTADHAILPNYTEEQIREQIASAQHWLSELTTKPVVSIAYPNGDFTPRIREICAELGLKAGFTVQPTKNALPLTGPSAMLQVSRFAPHKNESMRSQCRTYRSDFSIYSASRELYLRLAGRHSAQ